MDFKRILRGPFVWIVLAIVAIAIAWSLISSSGFKQISTQQGLDLLAQDGAVTTAKVVDGDQRVDLTLKDPYKSYGTEVQFYYVAPRGADVVKAVDASGAKYDDDVPQQNWLLSIGSLLLPVLVIGVICWFLLSSMQGGGNRVMQFGKSRAKLVSKESPKVTFADVAGVDEAVEKLQEIKDFLKDPSKFQAVGARIPKGVLLYGPPGTGKTLLARAVAGEAGVPFYSISGSDFAPTRRAASTCSAIRAARSAAAALTSAAA